MNIIYLVQRQTASPPMARMVTAQKILDMAEDPGIWGQPCRLVLSQKAENLLILKSLDAESFNRDPDRGVLDAEYSVVTQEERTSRNIPQPNSVFRDVLQPKG